MLLYQDHVELIRVQAYLVSLPVNPRRTLPRIMPNNTLAFTEKRKLDRIEHALRRILAFAL